MAPTKRPKESKLHKYNSINLLHQQL